MMRISWQMSQSGKGSACKGVTWEAVSLGKGLPCLWGSGTAGLTGDGLPSGGAEGKMEWSSASLAEMGWKNWDKHLQCTYPTTASSPHFLPRKCHKRNPGNVRPESEWETALQGKTSPLLTSKSKQVLVPRNFPPFFSTLSIHHLLEPTWSASNSSFPELRPGRMFIKFSHNTKSHIQRESYVHSRIWTVQWWGRGHWIQRLKQLWLQFSQLRPNSLIFQCDFLMYE